MKRKRLFCLRTSGRKLYTNADGVPYYYESKQDAKRVRDSERECGNILFVALGPDHWRAQA
jgi:hypothetical protein